MKTYSPDKILYPCFVQPKLNGIYAELGTDGIFRSRTGKIFPAIQDIWPKDFFNPELKYQGEFYVHRWPLQKIVSAVMPDEPNELSLRVEFHIYDVMVVSKPNLLQCERLDYMWNSEINMVVTELIRTHEEGTHYYESFLSCGYEGAVYRPYGYGDLLKRKPFKDAEFECVAVHEGLGKRKGHVGHFILQDASGRKFKCGGGRVSYLELARLLKNPPIGKMITVRYQHTSDAGIPLCAQFIAVRDYE